MLSVVVINALLFSLWHLGYIVNPPLCGEWMALGKLVVGLLYGLVLAYIRCRTKSTLCCILAHGAINSFLGQANRVGVHGSRGSFRHIFIHYIPILWHIGELGLLLHPKNRMMETGKSGFLLTNRKGNEMAKAKTKKILIMKCRKAMRRLL